MTADEIRREIDASRRSLQSDYVALRRELDFATKAKQAVVAHPLRWLGGAAFLGYLASPRKKSRETRRKHRDRGEIAEPAKKLTILGGLLAAARFVFPLVRPALTTFAVRKLSGFTGRLQ